MGPGRCDLGPGRPSSTCHEYPEPPCQRGPPGRTIWVDARFSQTQGPGAAGARGHGVPLVPGGDPGQGRRGPLPRRRSARPGGGLVLLQPLRAPVRAALPRPAPSPQLSDARARVSQPTTSSGSGASTAGTGLSESDAGEERGAHPAHGETGQPQPLRADGLVGGQAEPGPEGESQPEGHRVESPCTRRAGCAGPARTRRPRWRGRGSSPRRSTPPPWPRWPSVGAHRQGSESDRDQRRAHREGPGGSPVAGRGVQAHLEEDDQQGVDGEEEPEVAGGEAELAHHPHRHRPLVLEEDQDDGQGAEDDVAEPGIGDRSQAHRDGGLAVLAGPEGVGQEEEAARRWRSRRRPRRGC